MYEQLSEHKSVNHSPAEIIDWTGIMTLKLKVIQVAGLDNCDIPS